MKETLRRIFLEVLFTVVFGGFASFFVYLPIIKMFGDVNFLIILASCMVYTYVSVFMVGKYDVIESMELGKYPR